MLLSMEEMELLNKKTIDKANGQVRAVDGLTAEEKERLSAIDELHFITQGEHLIENFDELE